MQIVRKEFRVTWADGVDGLQGAINQTCDYFGQLEEEGVSVISVQEALVKYEGGSTFVVVAWCRVIRHLVKPYLN